jgi:hypothetical protein
MILTAIWSKILLYFSRELAQGCEGSFNDFLNELKVVL